MSEKFRHLLVGLTALCGLVGLAALLMLFGYVPDWVEGGYVVKVHMSDASGLTPGSRLKLNGIDIGRVVSVELQQPVNTGVLITTKVNEEFSLPKGVKASVAPTFLGGSPTLDLKVNHLTSEQAKLSVPRDGSAVIEGESASITDQLTAALDGPKKDLTRLVDAFDKLATEWAAVGKNINSLTVPTSPADVDNGTKTANLTTVLARADQRMAEMKTTLDGINKLVNDPALREDLKVAFANVKDASASIKDASAGAKSLIEKADGSVGKVDKLLDSATGNLDQLTKRYVAVADDLSGAILSMRKTIDQAREGDGTVGKLLNDPSLYNNLNDSVKKLDSALVDMKLLIQKWEKEGIIKF